MQAPFEDKYHRAEEHHPWFVGRREIILQLIADRPRENNIIDIGCSGGAIMRALNASGFTNVTGIDTSDEALKICKNLEIESVFQMDGKNPLFPAGSFDVIIASDVLEHIDDDKCTLKNWSMILKPGGIVICFVPAFSFLWSSHDIANNHKRRYEKKRLICLFENAGFLVKRSSYWNMALFLPRFLFVWFERQKHELGTGDHLYLPGRFISALLISIFRIENFLLRLANLPFGVSAFVVAEKRQK